jgi:hypothetical protein
MRETGTGQQVAKLLDSYPMMLLLMMMMMMMSYKLRQWVILCGSFKGSSCHHFPKVDRC